MAIHDKHIKPTAKVAEKELVVSLTTATSQSAVKALAFTPGHAFEIVKVKTWCSAITTTVSADVLIGSTSALSSAASFTATTENSATLSTTKANVQGDSDDQIVVTYTTGASGALTNGRVIVVYRIFPLAGEGFVS